MDIFLLTVTLVLGIAGMFIYIVVRLREIHLSMNSRLDTLLQKTDALARAEGFKAGESSYKTAKEARL